VQELAGLVVASIAAYAATDLDDIVVLALLFAAGRSARDVVVGQYLGIAALLAVSAAAAAGLLLVPEEVVGLLGLIPLAMGVHGLLRRGAEEHAMAAGGGVIGVAALTIANGGDNVAVYVPYFATAGAGGMAVIVAVFAVLVAVLCVAARALGTHPVALSAVRRYGHVAVPLVLIALGVAILVHAFA